MLTRILRESRARAERMSADLADLITIPSVTGSAAEPAAQQWVVDRLRASGLPTSTWTTSIDDLASRAGFPGVEAEHPDLRGVTSTLAGGDGPRLLLLGHTDVVPPADWEDAFRPVVTASGVTGRGAADMKGGVVSAIHSMEVLAELGVTPPGDVTLATVSAEEDGGAGTFDLLSRGDRFDRCVIIEPSDGALVIANGGALGFRLHVRGRSAHAARRWEGVDALEVLAKVRAALVALERSYAKETDPTMSQWPIPYPTVIGTVNGGSWASTVMAELTAAGRFGVPLGMSVADARADFERVVTGAVVQDYGSAATVTVEWTGGQFAPAMQDPAEPLLAEVARAHRFAAGEEPQIAGTTYGSDLRLTLAAGVPSVIYGPGSAESAHSHGEWVAVEDLVRVTAVLASVASGAATAPGPRD